MTWRLCLVRLNVSGILYNRTNQKKWKINDRQKLKYLPSSRRTKT